MSDERRCRWCGCTTSEPCLFDDAAAGVVACSWVEEDLCSACAGEDDSPVAPDFVHDAASGLYLPAVR